MKHIITPFNHHLRSLLLITVNQPIPTSRSSPAPLSLCSMSSFDLRDDTNLCPTEQNALKEFYHLAKGQEWTRSDNWIDEYISCCDWHGVTCADDTGKVVKLNMINNGLSGKLSASDGSLGSLKVLDLSDNTIKVKKLTCCCLLLAPILYFYTPPAEFQFFQGEIPSELEDLSNLTYLRLSYNSFIGSTPAELKMLKELTLIQLHSNRISGNISLSLSKSHVADVSSFVSDCGLPTMFLLPPNCDGCSICYEQHLSHCVIFV